MTTSKPRRPTFLQAMAIAGAGLLIALFGCLGALSGLGNGSSSNLAEAGIAGFVLGILLFIVGGILLLIVIIRPFFSKQQPADGADGSASTQTFVSPDASSDSPGPAEGE